MRMFPNTPITVRNMVIFMGVSMFMSSLFVLAIILYQPPLAPLPLKATLVDMSPDAELCPGDEVMVHSLIELREPTLLDIVITVMDEQTNQNIPNTQSPLMPRPHPHASTFHQFVPWVVPELPPGKYNRVTSYSSRNSDALPVFVIAPFHIGEDCP